MQRRQRARLQQIGEGLRPAGRHRVFLRNAEDPDWREFVNGEALTWTDAEVQAAEAAGDHVTCLVIDHVDGDDWRGLV